MTIFKYFSGKYQQSQHKIAVKSSCTVKSVNSSLILLNISIDILNISSVVSHII